MLLKTGPLTTKVKLNNLPRGNHHRFADSQLTRYYNVISS